MGTLAKIDSSKIRKEIQTLSARLHAIREEADHGLVRLSNLVYTVQQKQLFREWVDPNTKKPFTSFETWIKVDTGQSKASIYRFIGVKEHLKFADSTLESLGACKCFELVKVAKEKPKILSRLVDHLKKNPDIPLYTVQQLATNAIHGRSWDSGTYERIDFAVKTEDAPVVRKALAVMQAVDGVDHPETAAGRGTLLVSILQDYLSGHEEAKVLTKLEKAGAFNNSSFIVEE